MFFMFAHADFGKYQVLENLNHNTVFTGLERFLDSFHAQSLHYFHKYGSYRLWPEKWRRVFRQVLNRKEVGNSWLMSENPSLPLRKVIEATMVYAQFGRDSDWLPQIDEYNTLLLSYLGKKAVDDSPVSLETILDVCGLRYTLFVARDAFSDTFVDSVLHRPLRTFACACARKALPVFEAQFPGWNQPRKLVAAAEHYENGRISFHEMQGLRSAVKRVLFNSSISEQLRGYDEAYYSVLAAIHSSGTPGKSGRAVYYTAGFAVSASPKLYEEIINEFRLFCCAKGKYRRTAMK